MRSKPCVDPAHLGSPADLSHDVSEVCARLSAALSGDFVQAGTHEFSDPMGARLAGFVQRLIVAGQHASAQARERELELRLAHRVARIGTWRRDLRTNVLSWSDELHVLFGTDPAIFKPTPEGALLKVHPDDRSLVTAAYARVRQNGGSMEYEFRTVGDDGTIYWRVTELHAERDESGACVALRGVVQDVTERKRTLDQIQHLAHFDALTGLVNRSQLGEQLRRQLTVATRRGQKVAIHAVDLDGFKGVNDLHGHAAGDRLLQKLAGRLLQNVREGDTVARLGGDEFIIVQTEAEGAEDARRLADRIVSVLGAPCDLGGVSAAVTASIGIALFPDDVAPGNVEDAATGLLAAADTALCRVKQSPRNGHAFFQPGLDG